MRTTLNLDDDVLAAARVLAEEQGVSLGAAVSDLVRRGLGPRGGADTSGLPRFDVPDGAAPLTPTMVHEALDEP